MKFTTYASRQPLLFKARRMIYVGEEYKDSFDKIPGTYKEQAEKLEGEIKLSDYQGKAEIEMKGIIDGAIVGQKASLKQKLAEYDGDNGKIKKEKDKKKQETLQQERDGIQAQLTDLDKEDGALKTALKGYKETALKDLKTKIEAAQAARVESSKKYAEAAKGTLAAKLNAKDVKKRTEDPGTNFAAMKKEIGKAGDFIEVSIPRWSTVDGQKKDLNAREGSNKGSLQWKEDQVLTMVTEAIQTIYIEQGPEAAAKKVQEMQQNLLHNTVGQDDVDFNCLDKTFSGRGGFGYVLKEMELNTNDEYAPKLLGHVMGKMEAAKAYFSGDDKAKYLTGYEAYVQNAIKTDGDIQKSATDLLSPKEWIAQNADKFPEFFETPKDRGSFVDGLIGKINLDDVNQAAAAQFKERMKNVLTGALWAEEDPKKWDEIAQKVLAEMQGTDEFDPDKFTWDDLYPSKIRDGNGDYADDKVKKRLGEDAQFFVSGLLLGAQLKYGADSVDYKNYEAMVEEKLKADGDLMKKVKEARESKQLDEGIVDPNDPDLLAEIRTIVDQGIPRAFRHKKELEDEAKRKGDEEEAKKPLHIYDEKFSTESKEGGKVDTAFETYKKGREAFRKGDYTAAIAEYDKANGVLITPDSYYNKAIALAKMGKKDEAMVEMEKALEEAKKISAALPEGGYNENDKFVKQMQRDKDKISKGQKPELPKDEAADQVPKAPTGSGGNAPAPKPKGPDASGPQGPAPKGPADKDKSPSGPKPGPVVAPGQPIAIVDEPKQPAVQPPAQPQPGPSEGGDKASPKPKRITDKVAYDVISGAASVGYGMPGSYEAGIQKSVEAALNDDKNKGAMAKVDSGYVDYPPGADNPFRIKVTRDGDKYKVDVQEQKS